MSRPHELPVRRLVGIIRGSPGTRGACPAGAGKTSFSSQLGLILELDLFLRPPAQRPSDALLDKYDMADFERVLCSLLANRAVGFAAYDKVRRERTKWQIIRPSDQAIVADGVVVLHSGLVRRRATRRYS